MSAYQHFPDSVTRGAGVALVGSGLYGVLAPVRMSRIFGLKKSTPDLTIYYPGLAVRNLSAGIFVLALSYQGGYRRVLGQFLLIWSLVGFVDTKICLDNPPAQNVWIHVMNIGIAISTGVKSLME